MKQKVQLALLVAALLSAVAGYFSASESTRRYIVHLGKQVPYLPYRYFI
jgi:hypothetical protein